MTILRELNEMIYAIAEKVIPVEDAGTSGKFVG